MTETTYPYVIATEPGPIYDHCPVCGAMDAHSHEHSQHYTCGGWTLGDRWFSICPRAPQIVAKLREEIKALKGQVKTLLEAANNE